MVYQVRDKKRGRHDKKLGDAKPWSGLYLPPAGPLGFATRKKGPKIPPKAKSGSGSRGLPSVPEGCLVLGGVGPACGSTVSIVEYQSSPENLDNHSPETNSDSREDDAGEASSLDALLVEKVYDGDGGDGVRDENRRRSV